MRLPIHILLLCWLVLSGLSSCAFFQPYHFYDSKRDLQRLKKKDLSALEGKYKMEGSAWFLLEYIKYFDRDSVQYFDVEKLDEKHIKLTFYSNCCLLKEAVFKGKMKRGAFVSKTNRDIDIWVFVNRYEVRKYRFWLRKDGGLSLDYRSGGAGFMLIMPMYVHDLNINAVEAERLD